MSKFLVFIALMSQLVIAAPLAGASEQVYALIDEDLRVIPGVSETALYRNHMEYMRYIDGIQVQLSSNAWGNCIARPTHLSLEYSQYSQRQVVALDQNYRYRLPVRGLFSIKVHFQNPSAFETHCRVRAFGIVNPSWGPSNPPNPPPTGTVNLNEFRYVGVFSYDGGFSSSLELPIAPANPVSHIWIRMPNYCQGVEVLELSVGSNTEWLKLSELQDPRSVFVVDANFGKRIGGVRLMLNGPRSQSCEIPVYMRILGQENPFP